MVLSKRIVHARIKDPEAISVWGLAAALPRQCQRLDRQTSLTSEGREHTRFLPLRESCVPLRWKWTAGFFPLASWAIVPWVILSEMARALSSENGWRRELRTTGYSGGRLPRQREEESGRIKFSPLPFPFSKILFFLFFLTAVCDFQGGPERQC